MSRLSDEQRPQPVGGAPALTQEQARALGALLLCLQEHGGNGGMIDEDDAPSMFRMARIGGSLVVAEFAPDPAKGRLRQVDLYLTDATAEGPFPVDPRTRLVSFRATHFGLPPDWHVEVERAPEHWLGAALVVLKAAVQPVLDRSTPSGTGPPGP